jgi:hypothetical protein
MSNISMVLSLQKYNEENKVWQTVERQSFEWDANDLPEDEELTIAMVEYDVPNLDSGLYRTRCIFGAVDMEDDYNEAWNAVSTGLRF